MTNAIETKVVKVTKVQKFAKVIEILESCKHEDKEMLVQAMKHEIELLEKKKSSKTSKTNPLTEQLEKAILEVLTSSEKPLTITEMMKADERLQELDGTIISNQRVSRLANNLVEKGILEKSIDKKKSYFAIK